MVIKEIQNIFHNELDAIYGADEVDSFFFLLTEHYLNLNRLGLVLRPEIAITKTEEQPLFEALSRLKQQEPIQYILGETEFYGLTLKVNEYTLIPRPETEELVEFVVSSQDDWQGQCLNADRKRPHLKFQVKNEATSNLKPETLNIIDIGTGSGCIAIALAKHIKNAKVYACDISKEALKTARQNAELNGVNVEFFEADILNERESFPPFGGIKGGFDIVVSNPPYVRQLEKKEIKLNVLNHEPHTALFVDDNDPLVFYKAIAQFAVENLTENGQLFFEINQYLGNETKQLLEPLHFKNIELKQDMFGNDRMIKASKKQ